MNWGDLFSALALVLVIEGIIPFISPQGYKSTMQQLITMPDSTLRYVGLGLMIVGIIGLYLIRT